jgi:hypothetical protein
MATITRIGCFENGIGGKRRGHVNHAGIGAGLDHGFGNRVEHRQAKVGLSALAGGHAAHHVRAIVQRLLRMEGALVPGESLADDFCIAVDQDAHRI